MVTNEGKIDYRKIVGFKAEQTQRGWYRFYAKVVNEKGRLNIYEVCETPPEHFLATCKGIRGLAKLLTNDDCFVEI